MTVIRLTRDIRTRGTSIIQRVLSDGISIADLSALSQVRSRVAGSSIILSDSLISASGGSSEWADVYISNISSIGTHMAVSGRKVGFDVGSTFSGLGQSLTPGNGASMDIVTNGSFDGQENAVRIYPPTALVGENAQYASWLSGMELWNSGAVDIAQMNFRICVYYGPRYYDLAPPAKCWGFQCSTNLGPGGNENNRVGVFDYRDAVNWTQYKYPYLIVEGFGSYHEPETGLYIEDGSDANKLVAIYSAANHSASPLWQTASEWLCFETVVDLRQNRGNANGLLKLLVWTRDGQISARYLDIPLTWCPDWNFTALWCYMFEGAGFYFNTAGTAHTDNYLMHSHATFSANMAYNQIMGPPPGFLL